MAKFVRCDFCKTEEDVKKDVRIPLVLGTEFNQMNDFPLPRFNPTDFELIRKDVCEDCFLQIAEAVLKETNMRKVTKVIR